uniref:Uncharacterized protein n=1 Tax=Anopheles melas TaxID=34690 RepID=A0A182UD09_9DIPT
MPPHAHGPWLLWAEGGDRDRAIITAGGRRRWAKSSRAAVDGGSGEPLPAIGPSAPPYRAPASGGSGTNHSAASATATAIAVAHQNSINHLRAGSGGGGGYGYGGPSHAGDVDKPISAKLNLTTSPSSERRRKKANKQHPEQQRVRKREDTHPTVDAAKLLQR